MPSPLLRQVLGRCLRRIRHDAGRTLEDVATAAGVSVAHLSAIERGLSEPSSEILEAICDALGFELAQLLAEAQRVLVGTRPSLTAPGWQVRRPDAA